MSEEYIRKTCPQGHIFYKKSDCNSCPICASDISLIPAFLHGVSSPVRRALLHLSIDTPEKLASYRASEILALHGIGKTAIPKLKAILTSYGLEFKAE